MAISIELPVLESAESTELLDAFAKPLSPSKAQQILKTKLPPWFRIRPAQGANTQHILNLLDSYKLHTVCQEAHCPNLAECWDSGTATFMLGGDTCTRACRFCAVKTAKTPPPLDPLEPKHLAKAISAMKLTYVVLTSVNRDDLPDQAAGHISKTIREIKTLDASILVEALVPDFQGDPFCIETILSSGLNVYAHNIETVMALQKRVRDPRAHFHQSLATLKYAKIIQPKIFTKSSIMLGLGETADQLTHAFEALRENDVDILTLGQYLRPSSSHLPVEKFYTPEEFELLKQQALSLGFQFVAAGPLVRSSYKASEAFVQNHLSYNTPQD
jgi:lipoic acid synthetase